MSDQATLKGPVGISEGDLPSPVRAYIDAYNRRDVNAMLACLAEDVAFQNFSGGTLTDGVTGRKAFAQMAHVAAELFSEREQRVTAAITVGETTLLRIDYSAVPSKDLPNGWRAGEPMMLEGRSQFRLKAGKITHIVDES